MPVILVLGWEMKNDQEFNVILSHILSLRSTWVVSHPISKNNPLPLPAKFFLLVTGKILLTSGKLYDLPVMETVGKHRDIKDFCCQEPVRSWDPQS